MQDILIFSILELIIIGIFFLFLLGKISDAGDNTGLHRDYMAKDIGIMPYAIYAGNGEVDYTYFRATLRGDLFQYTFQDVLKISPKKISNQKNKVQGESIFHYPLNDHYEYDVEVTMLPFVRFRREGNKIIIGQQNSIIEDFCPNIDIDMIGKKILIDPAYGIKPSSIKGNLTGSGKKSKSNNTIEAIINRNLGKLIEINGGEEYISTRKLSTTPDFQDEQFVTDTKRLELTKGAELFLTLTLGYNDDEISIYYQPTDIKSKRLACEIKNSLSKIKKLEINIYPKYSNQKPYSLLSSTTSGVVIQYGNIDSKIDYKNLAEIGKFIHQGIKNYGN